MSLVMDKDDPSKGMDMVALFKILKEYKLGMHIMPLTDSSNLLLWDKMYPRPKTLH